MKMKMQESTESEPSSRPRLDARFIQELQKFNGEVWFTFKGIRIEIQVDAWKVYGTGHMTMESAHNFRQLAWVYLSQFNNKDLREALSNTIFHPEAPNHFTIHPKYVKTFDLKVQYINLTYTTGAYKRVDQWIREDKWCDPNAQRVTLEEISPRELPQETLHSNIVNGMIYGKYDQEEPYKCTCGASILPPSPPPF